MRAQQDAHGLSTREHAARGHVAIALAANGHHHASGRHSGSGSLGGKHAHTDSPRTPRMEVRSGGWASQLLAKKYMVLWLLALLVASCFAMRHGTRLLDAAGQQHHLLHLHHPKATAAAAAGGGDGPAAAAGTAGPQAQRSGSDGSGSSGNSTAGLVGSAAILAAQKQKWPDGYVAVCAVVKDQWPDLRYWIEYHRWLGVSKFYIYDNNSTLPSLLVLWDYLQEGIVDYQYFLGRPRKKPDFTDTNQYRAYQSCLLQHFRQHRWMAYIDADEFLVFPEQQQAPAASARSSGSGGMPGVPGGWEARAAQQQRQQGLVNMQGVVLTQESVAATQDVLPGAAAAGGGGAGGSTAATLVGSSSKGSSDGGSGGSTSSNSNSSSNSSSAGQNSLPVFLSSFEGQAAVGINWVLFGSSGQQTRPPDGPLASFTSCVPQTHWESTHVKVIANTGGILGMGYTPHEVITRPGKAIVDVDQIPFRGPRTPVAKWHKLVLHHYVLKSRAEFVAKKARGSGAGNRKDWSYWEYVEKLSNATCPRGVEVSTAWLASEPRLSLPRASRVAVNCHRTAEAAYRALLTPTTDHGGGGGELTAQQQQQQQAGAAGAVAGRHSGGGGSIDEWLPC